MDGRDFDAAVSPAFAFLVDEFGYKAQPPSHPRHHLEPNGKCYRKGELSICFFAGYDIHGHFVLDFSPTRLRGRAGPSSRVEYRSRWNYTLKKLLAIRGAKEPLPTEGTAEEVAAVFANLLRKHGLDVVLGDFSVFPPIVWSVELIDPRLPNGGYPIAACSTIEKAEAAVANVPEYMVRQETRFRITGWELNRTVPL